MPHSHELSHKEWALACLNGNVRAMANGTKTQADIDAWERYARRLGASDAEIDRARRSITRLRF